MSEEKLKDYVENKIYTYMFKAKNFSKNDMDFVNTYCKERYDNNRKLMILDLIKYKEDNVLFNIVNEKINFIYERMLEYHREDNEDEEPIKKGWAGLGNKK